MWCTVRFDRYTPQYYSCVLCSLSCVCWKGPASRFPCCGWPNLRYVRALKPTVCWLALLRLTLSLWILFLGVYRGAFSAQQRVKKKCPHTCWSCLLKTRFWFPEGQLSFDTIVIEGANSAFTHPSVVVFHPSGDYVEKVFYSWEFALSNSAMVLFVSVVSMEVNRRHYFQCNLCMRK